MAIHPKFPKSPYEIIKPELRWFPADETLREKEYKKLLPPLVAKLRKKVEEWRNSNYEGASETSKTLLDWWFKINHPMQTSDGEEYLFQYYFAQREAVETIVYFREIKDYYPDFFVKVSEKEFYIVETKGREDLDDPLKIQRLKQWCDDVNKLQTDQKYHCLYVKQEEYEKYPPKKFADLVKSFIVLF